MQIFHSPDDVHRFVSQHRAAGHTVGIVPTMGALHEGHLSLAQKSTDQCDVTIATIFVNPTQFAPTEDLDQYPRTLEQDCQLLESQNVAAVFVPASDVMYPPGFSTYVQPPEISRSLEGVCRPDHFRGVTTIVMKLFQILPGSHAFFGQKDYQQLKVVEAMVCDLDVPIQIVSCPIVRENDGLAMSSRNRYLSDDERSRALLLSKALRELQQQVDVGELDAEKLQAQMRQVLTVSGESGCGVDKIDYAAIVDAETLVPLDRIDRPAVALIAANVGQTRLIDNAIINL